jgi:hypothetical protein
MDRKKIDAPLHVEAGDDSGFDLDDLLHPAQAFAHPSEVVNDPDLKLNEKRAILASWASDACAVEAAPALRHGPNGHVAFDDVMDALRSLDEEARAKDGRAKYKKRLRITEVTDRLARKLRKPSGNGGYGPLGSFN